MEKVHYVEVDHLEDALRALVVPGPAVIEGGDEERRVVSVGLFAGWFAVGLPGCLRKRDSGSMVRLSGQPSGQPWMPGVDLVFGLDVVVEGDMPPGRWELREGDTVIGRGQLEEQ